MTGMQWFLFAGLPTCVGVVGVIYGETFRARQMKDIRSTEIKARAAKSSTWNYMVPATPVESEVISRIISRQKDIIAKYGTTPVWMFRQLFGSSFASGIADDERLGDIISRLDPSSLSVLAQAYELGKLNEIGRTAI